MATVPPSTSQIPDYDSEDRVRRLERILNSGLAGKQDSIDYTSENVANKKTSLTDNSDTYYPSQKAVKTAVDSKQDALGFTPENVANKDTSTSLGTSDTKYPSQKAVKTYVDGFVPKRASMFWDEATVSNGGGSVSNFVSASQAHAIYTWTSTHADADEMSHSFVCEAGDYTMYILYVKNTNSGKFDVYVDGSSVSSGNDSYAAVAAFNQILSITLTGLTAGRHTVKIKANGKNAASTSYYILTTKVWVKQSAD